MTDPLARIDAVLETLGRRGTGFWTPLDSAAGRVSNAEAQENRGFGRFGRFGHPGGRDDLGDEVIDGDGNAEGRGAETARASRASYPIQESVQTVQSVQNGENSSWDQRVGFGHLAARGVQDRGPGVQKSAREPVARRPAAPGGVPAGWAEGVARLREGAAPPGYPPDAWRQLILDAARFLERWGAQAAALGWPDWWELFGCHRRAPWGRIQGLGLVLLLRGQELAALTGTEAVIRTATGVPQTYHRKPRDPLHPAERCLIWELEDAC